MFGAFGKSSVAAAVLAVATAPAVHAAPAVTRIVLSHEHYDRVGGTEVFPGAQAIFELDATGSAPRRVAATFTDSTTMDFRGPTVELLYFGPADGFGSVVARPPDERVAFIAVLYGDRPPTDGLWMDDDNYLTVRRALRELPEMDPPHAVNAHSDDASVATVERNAAFVDDLFDLVNGEIRKAAREGGPAGVAMNLATWRNEPRLPDYADREDCNERLAVHVRRMALSIRHGG